MTEAIERSRQNPFIVLDALGEHVGSAWSALHRLELDTGDPQTRKPEDFPVGSVPYHLAAIDDAQQRLFQLLAVLLPANYRWSEGDEP
jgi:hypothetical protein